MSPRKCRTKVETAYAAARMLGITTFAITALHGPVLMNISASEKKMPA